MKVIWKRPDGFHGSKPADYYVVDLKTNSSKIWLHRTDRENFPFRVSGGWQDEDASRKLNQLVNSLLSQDSEQFHTYLNACLDDSKFEDIDSFLVELRSWLQSLKINLKGDTWELAVMTDTLDELLHALESSGST